MARLRTLARLLQHELTRYAPVYAARHAEHAALADYPTIPSLVARLTDPKRNKSRKAQHERSRMLCAIVAAYQPARDRLWSAILVAAYRPRVAGKRFYGADPEEREAIFFAALTEVAQKVDVKQKPDQLHAILWRRAKKVLVRKLTRQKAWCDVGFGEEAEATPDRTSWLPQPMLAAWALSRGAEDRPDLDLVVRVSEWGSLKAYVDAEYATLPPAERSRVYQRLSKRHRRDIAELRETFSGATEPGLPASVPPPESKTRLRADVAPTDVRADAPVTRDQLGYAHGAVTRDADGAVTCDRHGCADGAVTRDTDGVVTCDRHGCVDGAVTRDTPERALCDSSASAPSEHPGFDDTDGGERVTIATSATAREVLL